MDTQALFNAEKLADDIAERVKLSRATYDAFCAVPREYFFSPAFISHAYKLEALPLNENQWISSPLTVAIMTEALNLEGVDSILEIGCGSGFQAAILSKIVRRVFTIERIESLLKEAKTRFAKLEFTNIHARFDDGLRGWSSYAPYDRILFSAATDEVPQRLFDQLKTGGILVAPMQKDNKQIITRFIKNEENIQIQELETCLFVPIVQGVKR